PSDLERRVATAASDIECALTAAHGRPFHGRMAERADLLVDHGLEADPLLRVHLVPVADLLRARPRRRQRHGRLASTGVGSCHLEWPIAAGYFGTSSRSRGARAASRVLERSATWVPCASRIGRRGCAG